MAGKKIKTMNFLSNSRRRRPSQPAPEEQSTSHSSMTP
jgi:hypothetical protein